MVNRLLLTLLIASPLIGMTRVPDKNTFKPATLRRASILHKDNNFFVRDNTGTHEVSKANMDKPLRSMDKAKLGMLMKTGYVKVNKLGEGQYSLQSQNRLNGGGVLGAWFGAAAGGMVVRFLGHGTLVVIAACTGPAFPATLAALEGTLGGFVEGAAVTASVAGGIAGAVATGPV